MLRTIICVYIFPKKKAMQASFVAKEWVNHALLKSQQVESKLAHSDKVLAFRQIL